MCVSHRTPSRGVENGRFVARFHGAKNQGCGIDGSLAPDIGTAGVAGPAGELLRLAQQDKRLQCGWGNAGRPGISVSGDAA